jgi:hypothetical protein
MDEDKEPRVSPKPRILLTLAGGGFFWQSRSVARSLAGFDLHYASAEPASVWADSGLPTGTFHEVGSITTQSGKRRLQRASKFLRSASSAFEVVRRVDPDAVVCVASSIAVPLCFWAKLFGKKTVFIESVTRVSHPSATGTIIDRFRLCDRFYVQWPEAVSLYRKAVYRGTLF